MLDQRQVASALAAKRDRFARYREHHGTALEGYRRQWVEVATLTRSEIEAGLRQTRWPGALPTEEHDRFRAAAIRFAEHWTNHEEARAWALRTLLGVPTIAVDGSQIAPSRDLSPPVGAVQIGWYENPHNPSGDYVKNISFEVLAPDELAGEGHDEAGSYPDAEINWRRFQGECSRLIACMEAHEGREPKPVCFFDGSLILSFVQHLRPEAQAAYLRIVRELLAASTRTRVPLVGYVDTSYASDLVAMLDTLAGRDGPSEVSDGAFLRPLLRWGDRTPAWLCARRDSVEAGPEGKYYEQVGFVYLQTTAENPPARLDFPRWLLEAGELDRVVDIVRAECVIGNGYPYCAETADAVAVITLEDRQRFFAAFQRFAEQEGIPLRLRRKAASKMGRR